MSFAVVEVKLSDDLSSSDGSPKVELEINVSLDGNSVGEVGATVCASSKLFVVVSDAAIRSAPVVVGPLFRASGSAGGTSVIGSSGLLATVRVSLNLGGKSFL